MKRYRLYLKKYLRILALQWKRLPAWLRWVIIIASAVGTVYWMLSNPIYHASEDGTPTASKSDAKLKSVTGQLTKGTPEYKTFLPNGKSIDSLGGWTRVSPPDRNPVYAYADTLGGTPITVSQQPLPKEFKSDPNDQVAELAKNYHADHFITVDAIKVYIGTSAKGPQSVLFVKDATLVLIKSTASLSDDRWTEYVHSLR